MGIYNFYDKKKKRSFTDSMTISEKDKFLKENPHIEQRPPSKMNLGDAIRMGVTKPPSDFQKYVLGRIKARHPLGNVERKAGSIVREI